jgi:hypothetical protein
MLSTGEVAGLWNDMRGSVTMSGGHIQALAESGGNIDLFSGSSKVGDAGDISIVSGSSQYGGGKIDIIASASQLERRYWMQHHYQEIYSKEINFGFDEWSPLGFEERKIALQLKKTKESTR